MKHTLRVTVFMILIFICAQLIGLVIINEYVDIEKSSETGESVIKEEVYEHSIGGRPPDIKNKYWTVVFILTSILIGTIIILGLIKWRLRRFMKVWLFIAIMFCLGQAFSPFILRFLNANIPSLVPNARLIAISIACGLAYLKLFKPNLYIHNFTEIFVYGGLAAFVVPILNITWAIVLLIAISIYDMYAVWKSKHMVKMAQFQSESKIFPGLLIPYKMPKKGRMQSPKPGTKGKKVRTAILGGGDIAFPLLFSGTVLADSGRFLEPLIVTFVTALALFALLYKGKSDKFYPAMPFISIGCFVGYAITFLL